MRDDTFIEYYYCVASVIMLLFMDLYFNPCTFYCTRWNNVFSKTGGISHCQDINNVRGTSISVRKFEVFHIVAASTYFYSHENMD